MREQARTPAAPWPSYQSRNPHACTRAEPACDPAASASTWHFDAAAADHNLKPFKLPGIQFGRMKRRYASAMLAAVKSVAVATISASGRRSLRAFASICFRNISPNSSRPVVLGGRRLRNGCARQWASNFSEVFLAPPSDHPGRRSFCRRSTRHGRINNHVARTSVEGDHVPSLARGGRKGEIPDAADVLDDARADRVGEQHPIRKRHERRPLPACRHVAHAKVRDGRDPVRSAMTGFADLQRGGVFAFGR
jgi:hypothetical protein